MRNECNGGPKVGNGRHTWCLHADRLVSRSICESYRSDGPTIVKNKPQKLREPYYMVQGIIDTIQHTKESAVRNTSRINDVLEDAYKIHR